MGIRLVEDVLDSLLDYKRGEMLSQYICTLRKTKASFEGHTGVDGVSVLIGDLDAELLLDGHDDLDGVQAVQAKVIGEVCDGLDLFVDG